MYTRLNKNLQILLVGPMEIPIPNEKGAVEEIIWQLSRRLKAFAEVYVYNPIARHKFHKAIKGLRLLIREHGLIIHSHNLYATLPITLMCQKINHVFTLHFSPFATKSERVREIFIYAFKYLDIKGTIITVPSWYIKEQLKYRGIRRTVFIPNGVDVATFNPAKRNDELREKLLDGKDVLIVSVGRIHPNKNQLALIMALNTLVNNHGYKNTKLVLIGPTSGTFSKSGENTYYRLLVEYIQKHELKPYVTFVELQRKEEVARFLASSDIYVHPSKVEAAPLAVLEAMASKLPIIAFDLPYYKGYLINKFNSILVRYNNISDLAEALRILHEDYNLRLRLSQNAYNMATRYFSWDSVARQHMELYLSLVENE